ncbi:MAG TPA: hypothetical protein VFR28_00070 [Allosphingosinicella sp.]|nr:hypothetical protein [Allosphingosinicella sp.]
MRIPSVFLILAAAAASATASAQAPGGLPSRTLEAMRRDFPLDHQAIAATFAGKSPEEARRLAYAGIDRFLRSRNAAILAAPGSSLLAIEARQGALLRTLGRQDFRLCAAVSNRGFFSSEAAAAAAPAGLDEYGEALVEAAKTGGGAGGGATLMTGEDLQAWLAAVDKIEPGLPVWGMLSDPQLRARTGPDQLCRAGAAMHEAVATLPAGVRERVARTLLRSVLAS